LPAPRSLGRGDSYAIGRLRLAGRAKSVKADPRPPSVGGAGINAGKTHAVVACETPRAGRIEQPGRGAGGGNSPGPPRNMPPAPLSILTQTASQEDPAICESTGRLRHALRDIGKPGEDGGGGKVENDSDVSFQIGLGRREPRGVRATVV